MTRVPRGSPSAGPSTSAVTPCSAFNAVSSVASILAVERSPSAPPSNCHIERIDRALGLPEVVGNDADGVVVVRARTVCGLEAGVLVGDRHGRDLHHGAHAGHLEDLGLVLDRDHLPGEGRRRPDGGVEHSGHRHVDAEDRAAVALGRRIQARDRLADQANLPASLSGGAELSGSLAASAASSP